MLLPLSLVLSSGCAKDIVATAEPFCAAATVVCIAADDKLTEPTARQIEANNLGLIEACKIPKAKICPRGQKPTLRQRLANR